MPIGFAVMKLPEIIRIALWAIGVRQTLTKGRLDIDVVHQPLRGTLQRSGVGDTHAVMKRPSTLRSASCSAGAREP